MHLQLSTHPLPLLSSLLLTEKGFLYDPMGYFVAFLQHPCPGVGRRPDELEVTCQRNLSLPKQPVTTSTHTYNP